MSDETSAEQAAEETGGEEETSSRISGGCVVVILSGIALLILKAVVTAAPYTAYFVAGVLACVAWQKARAWVGRRRGQGGEEGEEQQDEPDVGEALRRLVGDDKGVLLTRLQKDLGLPDTKAVKVLLEAEGIPWKPSRTREGNGPAVRKEAIPAAPSPVAADVHGEGCCCRSGGNGNGNNDGNEGAGEGLRVEAIGQAGHVVRHPADVVRHHKVGSRWGHSGNGAS